MRKFLAMTGWLLLALALVIAPISGCQGGKTSSGASLTVAPEPSSTTTTPTQTAMTFIPPVVVTTTTTPPPVVSSLPPPVAITTMTTDTAPATTTEPVTTSPPTTEPVATITAPPTSAAPTTTPPPVTTIALPEDALMIEMDDAAGDLFDAQDNPVTAEAYLDIVKADVYVAETRYFFRMKLGGPLPAEPQETGLTLEWDFFIDADSDATTGWAGGLIANDTGPDYLVRLIMQAGRVSAELYDVHSASQTAVYYHVAGDTLDLSFTTAEASLDDFSVVAACRKWREASLVAADKAPDLGHYNTARGYVYVEPGLPTERFETVHATVWYNRGNEERAQACADAFETAYTKVADLWGVYPTHGRIYVYHTQADLVQGLLVFDDYDEKQAAAYQSGGAPRSTSDITHIPPDYDWLAVFHQQMLRGMDLFC